MSAAELDEVQALLEHMLPDPSGYAQRVLMQAMTKWGQAARPQDNPFYPPPPAGDQGPGAVITPGPGEADGPVVDTNLLLAAALGACECWGLRADCTVCRGYGSAGWTEPDPELFEEFVQPAIERLCGAASTPKPAGRPAAGSSNDHHTEPGESR